MWLVNFVGRWQFAKRSFEDVRSQAGTWERVCRTNFHSLESRSAKREDVERIQLVP